MEAIIEAVTEAIIETVIEADIKANIEAAAVSKCIYLAAVSVYIFLNYNL